jgi:hypothetical protein
MYHRFEAAATLKRNIPYPTSIPFNLKQYIPESELAMILTKTG